MDSILPPPLDPYRYEGHPAVKVRHAYLMMGISFVFFSCFNYIIRKEGPPARVTGDIWRWRNTFVSFFHSSIVGTCVLYCLKNKDLFHDPILFCDYFTYLLIAFSEGYFLYDFCDYVLNKRAVKNYEVIIHHCCAIWSFWYAIQYRVNIGYTIIGLMTEVNSSFLHGRKLLQFNKWPFEHWLYRLVVGLNLLTFVTFRFTGIIYIGYGIVIESRRGRITFVLATVLSVIMVFVYILNPVLLWRLFKNDVLRNLPYRRLKMEKNKLEVNGNCNHAATTMEKDKLS